MKFKNFKLDKMFLSDSGFINSDFENSKIKTFYLDLVSYNNLLFQVHSYPYKMSSIEIYIADGFELDKVLIDRVLKFI